MGTKVTAGARYLLGLLFLIFGANGLVMIFTGNGFLPMPPPGPGMTAVMSGLFAAGYLMPLVKALEVLAGLLLISGQFLNLAIVLLGPIVINILGLHIFVEPAGLPIGIGITALWGILLLSRWKSFKNFLLS